MDDQIQSAPTLGRLAYTTPSLPDLYGVPMEAFANHFTTNKGDDRLRFDVIVRNKPDEALIPCSESHPSKCRINFSKAYTPMLHDISPNEVYAEQELTFTINAMGANNPEAITADADPVDFIKFSGTRNDFEELFDSSKRLKNWRIDWLLTHFQLTDNLLQTGNRIFTLQHIGEVHFHSL